MVDSRSHALLAALLVATGALSVHAADLAGRAAGRTSPAHVFNIESLPLQEALQELARQSGVQIVFLSALTEGHHAPALSGTYKPIEALSRLLEGSGLAPRVVNARTFEVRRPSNRPRRALLPTPDESLAQVQIVATVENLVATRIPTPLREIPQSVSIVSSEQIRQQNQFELKDVLVRTPGLSGRQSNSLEPEFFARRFMLSPYQLDRASSLEPRIIPSSAAYIASSPNFVGSPDLSEFDRIEVLRGSDALFAGNGHPGGTLSFVRKRPLPRSRIEVSALVGSWNQRRIEVDLTGPLTENGALRGRADAVYEDRDYFFDIATLKRRKIFAVLDYDITADSKLTTGGSYQWDNARPLNLGWPWYADGTDSRLPRNLALTTEWSSYRTQFGTAYLQYDGRIRNDWRLKLNAGAGRLRAEHAYPEFSGAISPVTQRLNTQPIAFYTPWPAIGRHDAVDATLTGTLHLFGLREEIALGADYSRSRTHAGLSAIAFFGPVVGDVRQFDPNAYPDPRLAAGNLLEADSRTVLKQYGAFASLRAHFTGAWSLTLGARAGRDHLDQDNMIGPLGISFGLDYGTPEAAVTPLAAVMYRINEHHSWYASFADTYVTSPPFERANGERLRATHGATFETGIKGAWREGKLNGFLALYRIEQRVPSRDTLQSDLCCWVQRVSRSDGLDIDLNGEVMPGWLVGAGYSYTESSYAENRPEVEASLTPRTPRHLMKLWTSVRLRGEFDRWTVGGNLRAQTKVDSGERFYCPGGSPCAVVPVTMKPFAVLDLRAAYEIHPDWEIAVNVNNVRDKVYYESVHGPTGTAWYGEPRNFALRIDGRL